LFGPQPHRYGREAPDDGHRVRRYPWCRSGEARPLCRRIPRSRAATRDLSNTPCFFRWNVDPRARMRAAGDGIDRPLDADAVLEIDDRGVLTLNAPDQV